MRKRLIIGAVGGGAVLAAFLIPALLSPRPTPAAASPAANRAEVGCQDRDGDGFGPGCQRGADCNDRDPSISPASREACNDRDDDCNALVDDEAGCEPVPHVAAPIEVAASTLLMGSPAGQGAKDEHPQHLVQVSAFSMDRYEVTNERYAECVEARVCTRPQLASSAKRAHYYDNPDFARYPVVFVSWSQARQFCEWEGARLPTEAEWELAARGPSPSTSVFPWGDDAPDCSRANGGGDQSCLGDTDLVGRRAAGASPWGAMDMAGNVWEWTGDRYDASYYEHSPRKDPTGPDTGNLRVMRGGCWMSGADSLRVSCRKAELPDTWAPNVGFRCVRPEGGAR